MRIKQILGGNTQTEILFMLIRLFNAIVDYWLDYLVLGNG